MVEPHWEYGYRCHGYWLGEERIGAVGIGPGRGAGKKHGYGWLFKPPRPQPLDSEREGREKTLKAAKKQVEKAYQRFLEDPKNY